MKNEAIIAPTATEMDHLNFTIPVQQLRGLKITKGVFPGWWSYPSAKGSPTTKDCAIAGLYHDIFCMVTGMDRRIAWSLESEHPRCVLRS